ncbi:hypothetical protein MVEG_10593 [Podila verticillata NRRL 6337]|nr:hypothetical protein MVEG_10593 [Podila verticillata NRRL 6337]
MVQFRWQIIHVLSLFSPLLSSHLPFMIPPIFDKNGNYIPCSNMSIISGQLVASPNAGASAIDPNSRVAVQLLDVSRMDAPSVTLSEQVFQTGPSQLSFPIAYSLSYEANDIKPHQSLSIAARVTTDADTLTWITTTRHSVLTFHNPSDNVLVELDQMAEYSGEPAPSATINGNVFASSSGASAKIAPKSKITIQLLDVSLMDAPSVTLSEQVIETGNDDLLFPIQYRIGYDPARIEDHHSYSLSVRIEDEAGNLTWASTYSNNVLTSDNPSDHVSIELEKVQH